MASESIVDELEGLVSSSLCFFLVSLLTLLSFSLSFLSFSLFSSSSYCLPLFFFLFILQLIFSFLLIFNNFYLASSIFLFSSSSYLFSSSIFHSLSSIFRVWGSFYSEPFVGVNRYLLFTLYLGKCIFYYFLVSHLGICILLWVVMLITLEFAPYLCTWCLHHRS